MSTGAPRPHAGLMPETSRLDLELAWKEREAEAAHLATVGFDSMALAIRLYSLEIRLKWLICRHLGLEYLPKACKTHDLTELAIYTGLWPELDDPAHGNLRSNWDRLADFSKKQLNDLRYLPRAALDSGKLAGLTADLDEPTDGVLAWLSGHP